MTSVHPLYRQTVQNPHVYLVGGSASSDDTAVAFSMPTFECKCRAGWTSPASRLFATRAPTRKTQLALITVTWRAVDSVFAVPNLLSRARAADDGARARTSCDDDGGRDYYSRFEQGPLSAPSGVLLEGLELERCILPHESMVPDHFHSPLSCWRGATMSIIIRLRFSDASKGMLCTIVPDHLEQS